MEYKEDDYLNLSGIQHFSFCRRQWALIHIEQQWMENYRTVEGEILHERAHDELFHEKRNNIITSRGMRVHSRTLGVNGSCDVVEFHVSKEGIPIHGMEGTYQVVPVEYKRGEPKEEDSDLLQLCTQAICLEEMLLCSISHGYIYYGLNRRRYRVDFTMELRSKVELLFSEMHQYFTRGYTPKVKITKACNACSLKELCIPKLNKQISANEYIKKHMRELVEEGEPI